MTYPIPDNETERLRALERYDVLDTPPEESFDRITRLAAELLDMPTALLSLIGQKRQWFKSCFAFNREDTDREIAFCSYTILNDAPMVVEDATDDPRFASNPLVTGDPGIRFYAGVPLTTPDGFNIGTLCLIDTKPRHLDATEVRQLEDLAAMAMNELELRREVEAQRKHERALQASESRFRGLVSNLPGQVYRCTYNTEWSTLYMSKTITKLCGLSTASLEQGEASFKDLVHEDDLPRLVAAVREAVVNMSSYKVEYRLVGDNGKVRWVEDFGRPSYDESGNVRWLDGVLFDVTQRKKTEERLRLLETAVRDMTESVLITDTQLDRPGPHIVYVNRGFEQMTGYERDEVLGKTPRILQGPATDPDLMRHLRTQLENDDPFNGETINYRKNGEPFFIEWSISPVRHPDEETITHYVAVQRDVTERREAEQKVRRALEKERELNELKSRFVSMASHELRTPLATIQSSAQLVNLFTRRGDDENVDKHLSRIQSNINKMTDLLEDVLLFGRGEQGHLPFHAEEQDVMPLLQETVEEVRQGIGASHTIELHGTDRPLRMTVDAQLFDLLISNLLGNAVKYSDEGSVVELTIRNEGEGATLTVRDRGIGIPDVDQERLFEPFHRAANVGATSGTGLGLSIVKEAVDLHSGSITVESEQGEGSTFTVTLPRHQDATATSASEADAPVAN